MEKKFKETSISEDYSKCLSAQHYLIGPSHVWRIPTILFHGASMYLAAVKNTATPKALVFRAVDGRFLAAAKVCYIPNNDDPTNPAAGQWSYTWTTDEDNIKDCDCCDVSNNAMIVQFFTTAGINLYNLKFAGPDVCITMMVEMVEFIIKWLKENVTAEEPVTLIQDGVFRSDAAVDENGEINIGIIPDGQMKVLIKDDSAIQDAA